MSQQTFFVAAINLFFAALMSSQLAGAGVPTPYPVERVFPLANPDAIETWSDASEDLMVLGHGLLLEIYDVSNASNVTRMGRAGIQTVIRSIDISPDGNTVAVSDHHTWITLIDITNRKKPQVLSRFQNIVEGAVKGAPYGLKFDPMGGDLLYAALGSNGLLVVDIQIPTEPEREGMVSLPSANLVVDVEVLGSYAFISRGEDGLTAIDISDPANPAFSSTVNTIQASTLTLDGSRLYVTTNSGTFHIVDLNVGASPATMRVRGTPDLSTVPGLINSLKRIGIDSAGRAVVADANFRGAGLVLFDVTDPDDPTYLTHLDVEPITSLALIGDTVFTTPLDDMDNTLLHAINVAGPTRGFVPVLLDTRNVYDLVHDVDLRGEDVVVSYGGAGVLIYDLSNSEDPFPTAEFRFSDRKVESAVLVGNTVVTAAGNSTLGVVDLTDNSSPIEYTPFDVGGSATRVDRLGSTNQVFTAASFAGLHLIDFTDPSSPTTLGTWDEYVDASLSRSDSDGSRVAVWGSNDGTSTVWILDFSVPASPVELGSFEPGYVVNDLQLLGNRLHVSSVNDGYHIWDITSIVNGTDPSGANTLGSFTNTDLAAMSGEGLAIVGDLAYVASSTLWGLLVLDISDATDPVLLQILDTPGDAVKVDADTERLVLADWDAGARFFGFEAPPTGPTNIFADGFESGGTTAWQ